MRLLVLIKASESSSHIKKKCFLFCFVFYLILKGPFRDHDSYAKNEGVYGAFHYALEVEEAAPRLRLTMSAET